MSLSVMQCACACARCGLPKGMHCFVSDAINYIPLKKKTHGVQITRIIKTGNPTFNND